jgi:cytoskeletal protein CcmA (bactofilin family)
METPKPPQVAPEMTLISKSVAIKGEVSCDEDLYIDGQVEGTIDPKGYRLTIGPNGRVKANITARAVVVLGRLEGNIQASDRVDLKQSATVVGDIVTQRISIDEGVTIKGSVKVQKELPKNDLVGMTPLLSSNSK